MDNKKENFWQRMKGNARKTVIAGALALGLAGLGVVLPQPVQTAIVVGIDSVIEAL